MSKMKPVKWSLDTLTKVKRLTLKEMMNLDLHGRQIVICLEADKDIGASKYGKNGKVIYTKNGFPIAVIDGRIKRIERDGDKITFHRTGIGRISTFTPDHNDLVFIIEKDDDTKGKSLNPEYAWRPE